MKRAEIEKLRQQLASLVESAGVVALKTGTEVEDMSFADIDLLKTISRNIVPLYVKIGGPEARNDIRELVKIGVDGLIAPMIESVYALRKFIDTLREILDPSAYARMEKGINLETIQGFKEMNTILSAPEARELNQITAARTDLSGSMNLEADNERVFEICSVIVARAREYDIRTSVGGAIHPGIVKKIIGVINPDTINSRHMVISVSTLNGAPEKITELNLEFEACLYDAMAESASPRSEAFAKRAAITRERISQSRTLNYISN